MNQSAVLVAPALAHRDGRRSLPVASAIALLLVGCALLSLSACKGRGVGGARAAGGAPASAQSTFDAGTPLADATADGPQLYARYCALCHGANRQGYAADNAPSLISKTFRETASDEFLRAAIGRGRPGTAMAGYASLVGGPLGMVQINKIVAFLLEGGPTRISLPVAASAGNAGRGAGLYTTQCMSCHGTTAQRGNAVHLSNGNFLNSASDAYLKYAVQHGRPGTRMDAWEAKIQPEAIDDVVAYLRSLAPLPPTASPLTAVANTAGTTGATGALAGTMTGAMEQALPIKGPLILNRHGQQAELKLRDDRYAAMADVKAALDGKRRIVIIDARTPSDWMRLRIPGSISIPYYDMKALDDLPNDGTWIIAYCACPHHASGVIVDELRKRNFKHSAVLDEGIFAWQQKGYPVIAAPGSLPVPAPPKPAPPTTGMDAKPAAAKPASPIVN